MKKSILLIILSCLCVVVWAQPMQMVKASPNTTTIEEYNYVTKGYAIQLEAGLDMKKGYELRDLCGFEHLNYGTDTKRGCSFKSLHKQGYVKPCAIMMIYERRTNDVTARKDYYCIPTSDAPNELWDKLFAQINADPTSPTTKDMYGAMIWATMKLSSLLAQK
jgi:hypothetical protein